MKTNEKLQIEIQQALQKNPLINVNEIAVTVQDGIVTLSGIVDVFEKKKIAEEEAKNVEGVKAVIENIIINYENSNNKDHEIASSIVTIFNENWDIPENKINIKVENGWVSLDGEVSSKKEKDTIKEKVQLLSGVKGITNNIRINKPTKDEIKTKRISNTLSQNPTLINQIIMVTVLEKNVTLKGMVDSQIQKDEAGKIALRSLGILTLENELFINEFE
jgi:osmotically-inducible protein OsmY